MSTSLLYHAFGIKGYRYVRTAYVQGQTIFTLGQGRDTWRCSACRSADVVCAGPSSGASVPCPSDPVPRPSCFPSWHPVPSLWGGSPGDVTFADPRRSYTRPSRGTCGNSPGG